MLLLPYEEVFWVKPTLTPTHVKNGAEGDSVFE